MSVSFEKKETNRGVLTFTISQEQIKPELDRVFNSVKKTINVPGFRKGHLPRPVFNQKFGEEALYQDALNNLLPNAKLVTVEGGRHRIDENFGKIAIPAIQNFLVE